MNAQHMRMHIIFFSYNDHFEMSIGFSSKTKVLVVVAFTVSFFRPLERSSSVIIYK